MIRSGGPSVKSPPVKGPPGGGRMVRQTVSSPQVKGPPVRKTIQPEPESVPESSTAEEVVEEKEEEKTPGIVEAIEPGVPMTKGSSGCFCSLFPGAYERNLGLRQGFFDIRRKRITQSLSECP